MPEKQLITDPKEAVREAINRIIASPNDWCQDWWHKDSDGMDLSESVSKDCATKHCFLGWVDFLTSETLHDGNTTSMFCYIEDFLRIDPRESRWVASPYRNFPDLYYWTESYIGGLISHDIFLRTVVNRGEYYHAPFNAERTSPEFFSPL